MTNMSYMFSNASKFNQDISEWNISEKKDIAFLFYGAKAIEEAERLTKTKAENVLLKEKINQINNNILIRILKWFYIL